MAFNEYWEVDGTGHLQYRRGGEDEEHIGNANLMLLQLWINHFGYIQLKPYVPLCMSGLDEDYQLKIIDFLSQAGDYSFR